MAQALARRASPEQSDARVRELVVDELLLELADAAQDRVAHLAAEDGRPILGLRAPRLNHLLGSLEGAEEDL